MTYLTAFRQTFSVCMVIFLLVPAASPVWAVPTADVIKSGEKDVSPTASETASVVDWCVTGDFNSWNNSSHPLSDLSTWGDLFSGMGIYYRDEIIPTPGRYEFKIVECGNWGVSFPASSSWFYTTVADQLVRFTFDRNDYSDDAGVPMQPFANIVNVWGDTLAEGFTAVGDFQGWNNADPSTGLTYEGRGIYRLAYQISEPGSFIGKVTRTGSWDAFGADGRSTDAWNLSFSTSAPDQTVIFLLDTRTGRLAVTPNGSSTGSWCVMGSFNGWDNNSHALNDSGTAGDLLGGDGIFSLDMEIPSAGRHEWKVVECGDWGNAYPAQNAWLNTAEDGETVRFTFDTNDRSGDAGLPLFPYKNIVNAWDDLPGTFTAVGSFQGWNNSDPATLLQYQGNGWHSQFVSILTAGTHFAKITTTDSWDAFGLYGRSVDAQNLSFHTSSEGAEVLFVLDAYSGRLAVLAAPPAAPQNLSITGTTPGSISLAWDANTEPDLAGYEVFRKLAAQDEFSRIARLGADAAVFVDETVITGETYYYYLLAFDTIFNRSDPSNIVQATAEARQVAVTFSVEVPSFTPGTVYIAGSIPGLPLWNPSATPMTRVSDNTWSLTLPILDGMPIEYKFTRGSCKEVETGADGNEELENRQLQVSYGEDGTQVVNNLVANWRDPIVVAYSPQAGDTGVPVDAEITVTWSQAMPPSTSFIVEGPDGLVTGTFSYDSDIYKVTFTPSDELSLSAEYTVSVSGQVDVVGDNQIVSAQWSFSTEMIIPNLYFPIIMKH